MKLNCRTAALAAALASALSSTAVAADDPFFQLTEISTGTREYGYKIAHGTDDYLTVKHKYDWWSYFDSIPTEIDLSDRFSYSLGCIYDSKVCDGYYEEENENDGYGHSFFKALVENTPYTYSLLNSGDSSDNLTGFRRSINSDGSVITGWVDNTDRSFENGVRFPVVWINGTETVLGNSGHGQASTSFTTDDGTILVGGAAPESIITDQGNYRYCYEYYQEYNFREDLLNCPGYHNSAVLWALSGTGELLASQFLAHYSKADNDELSTADVRRIIKLDDTYYAFGYSATDEIGADSTNIATYWTFKYEDGAFSEVSDHLRPSGLDRPGEDDEYFGSTWFADANSNGFAIGNARYNKMNRNSYPIEMFIYDVRENTTSFAVKNKPFYGATNRAVAINEHNLVVGVSDYVNSQETVVYGNPREKAGFLYNHNTGSFYDLNDLICSSDSCEIDGKYYFIYNVGDISDNNTIIANAYRYDSYEDWAEYSHPTNVTITLTSDKFDVTDDSYDIPEDYVVKYTRPRISYDEKKGGHSGSMSDAALLLLILLAATGRRLMAKGARKGS